MRVASAGMTASRVPDVSLPHGDAAPLAQIGRRALFALGLVVVVVLTVLLDASGYRDVNDDGIGVLDAFYYATVSITTTGYGDITPATDTARLLTTLVVTPARVLFLILLVGTTLEILAERSRRAFAESRWRKRLHDHVIVCGYGTKGRAAVETIVSSGGDASRIVVIDPDRDAIEAANQAGLGGIVADAGTTQALRAADVEKARQVVVATHDDGSAVLIALTARELNADATIVAAVRETENAHLLHQSGADAVITTSSAAGRLLGLATRNPRVVEVLEDLLKVGQGLDIVEREVVEPGSLRDQARDTLVVAVVRGEELLRFDDDRAQELSPGDRIVCLCSQPQG